MPLLEKVGTVWPDAEIDIAVPAQVADLLGEVPRLHCLALRDFDLMQNGSKRKLWFSRILYRHTVVYHLISFCCRAMSAQEYEIGIAPRWGSHATWPAVYLAYLSGARRIIGYSGSVDGGTFATDQLLTVAARGGEHEHESARNLALLIRGGLVEHCFDITEAVYQPISSLVKLARREQNSTDHKWMEAGTYAVISPGATASFRTWSTKNLIKVVRGLHQETGFRFYVVGGLADELLCRSIADGAKECAVSIAGQTSLKQLAGLLAGATLFIGMDSGTAHIAGALAVPTIVISPFPLSSAVDHPNSPARFRPCGPNVRVLQPEHPIPPCDPTCSFSGSHCIEQITPASVVTAVMERLQSKTSSSRPQPLPSSG